MTTEFRFGDASLVQRGKSSTRLKKLAVNNAKLQMGMGCLVLTTVRGN